ncbi:MAG: HlyD family secretion protein [Gammaproteobacteria bacterium]|nr:HlyD family secretion protein [Gammaproteobacteria bacterium]
MSDRNDPQQDSGEAARSPDRASPADDPTTAPPAPAPRPRGRWLRRVLLLAGPVLVVAVGAYLWYTGGRHVETENAYVKADVVVVSSEVAGPIERVEIEENERVAAGDVLFTLDARPFRVALARAEAQLAAVGSMIESVKASYRQRLEELELARTDYAFAERELEREIRLAEQELGSEAAVDRARHEFDAAAQRIRIVERGLEQLRAQLGDALDGSVTGQAAYRAAKAARDAAALDLEHTVVRAPIDGVASRVPVVGHYAAPGAAVMSIVSDRDVWIEANYKETDLTHVCAGQPVEIHIDTYPDRAWSGRVASISQATGAEFSVLPAQNATGNWVKVIQRIPVRVAVRRGVNDPPLRTGMSATVSVDTGRERPLPALPWLAGDAVAGGEPASDKTCNAE